MKTEETELRKFILNPSFLELMKQSVESVQISPPFSFNIDRNGRQLHITIYGGKEGQVNISDVDSMGYMRNTILRDYCQTPEDFRKMLEKLDDLLTRMPKLTNQP